MARNGSLRTIEKLFSPTTLHAYLLFQQCLCKQEAEFAAKTGELCSLKMHTHNPHPRQMELPDYTNVLGVLLSGCGKLLITNHLSS